MPKGNPFALLSTLPARERPLETTTPSEASAEIPTKPVAAVRREELAPAPIVKFGPDKALREKRTTRIDPNVYDAVERELTRQKRSRERATSTLSDLLDELLRNWLREQGIEP